MSRWQNYLLFGIMCLIWSTTWSALKMGLEETPPLIGLALRFAIAGFTLMLILRLQRKSLPFSRPVLRLYFIVGIFNMGLSYYATYWGTQYITSGLSSIIWATFPLMIGLGSYLFLPAEKLNLLRFGAILLALGGIVLIFLDERLLAGRNNLLGALAVLGGVAVASFPNIYLKKYSNLYQPLPLTTVAVLLGAFLHLVAAWLKGEFSRMVWDFKNIGLAAYLGVFGTAATFLIYYWLLQRVSVTKLSFVTFIPPIFALLIGNLLLQESITLQEIGGMILIFCGIFIYDLHKYQQFFQSLRLKR